jgi:hypothetical protein
LRRRRRVVVADRGKNPREARRRRLNRPRGLPGRAGPGKGGGAGARPARSQGAARLGRLRWGMTAGSHLSARRRRREATRAAVGRWWAAKL